MDTPVPAVTSSLPRSGTGVLLLVASASAALAATATYFGVRRNLETKYKQIAIREIADAREYYARRYKADDFETPGSAVDALIGDAADAVRAYEGDEPVGSAPRRIPQPEVSDREHNIFLDGAPLGSQDNFDYEAEVALRTPGTPYVITYDEFMENDPDHNQPCLTYFADGILVDQNDEIIENVDDVVGLANLVRFGHGSNDSKIVYVRNERLSLDFEIARSPGTYAAEVGLEEHQDPRHHRRDDG